MPVNYNPSIIQEYADRLYKKASNVIAMYAAFGVLIGLGVGGFIAHATKSDPLFLFGLGVTALISTTIGNEKAFNYRLQAQLALCNAKIEENTRPK